MPLPDERPRQSVANLIGRFEQQSKRQSIGSAPPLLTKQLTGASTASVGEQNSKDANKEKPVVAALKDLTKPEANPTPIAPSNGSVDKPKPSPAPPTSSPPLKEPEPVVDTAKPRSSKPVTSPPSSFSSPATKRTISHQNTSGATSIKSALRRPPSSASKSPPSVAKPLKPQHTGQSTASNASTVRAKPPLTKTIPSTPSRPKTPATRPKTPAANTKAVSRPKTPSSGLYAPTAASLAKAKSAAPSSPTPVRKTISATAASVSERLSKPTAASASKAKAPVVATPATPARTTKPPVRGAAPTRAVVKPRVGLAGARLKQDKGTRPVGTPITNVVASQATGNGNGAIGLDHHDSDSHEAAAHEVEIESYDSDFVDESFHVTQQPGLPDKVTESIPIPDQVMVAEPIEVPNEVPTPEEPPVPVEQVVDSSEVPQTEEAEVVPSTEPKVIVASSTAEVEEHEDDEVPKDEPSTAPAEEPHVEEQAEETKPEGPTATTPAPEEASTPDSGNGIEDMVSMLELRPPKPSRPVSMSSFPGDDATGSIPDEE